MENMHTDLIIKNFKNFRKCIGNSMENMHTDLIIKNFKNFKDSDSRL